MLVVVEDQVHCSSGRESRESRASAVVRQLAGIDHHRCCQDSTMDSYEL